MHLQEGPKPRTLTTPNAAKDVEWQEFCITGGNAKCQWSQLYDILERGKIMEAVKESGVAKVQVGGVGWN